MMLAGLTIVLFSLLSALASSSIAPDENENCAHWASLGECDKNPGFMLPNCATSCDQVAKQALKDASELQSIGSFFDLKANDIHGKEIDFQQFKGQVTVIVNVASYCGYTDSHYKSLVRLSRQVEGTTTLTTTTGQQINIMAFPCNQFGKQEPGTAQDILKFTNEEYDVGSTKIRMMEKVDVNGGNASIVYKFLKSKAGPASIAWNFATYFVIAPDGNVEAFSDIEPLELKDTLLSLFQSDEL